MTNNNSLFGFQSSPPLPPSSTPPQLNGPLQALQHTHAWSMRRDRYRLKALSFTAKVIDEVLRETLDSNFLFSVVHVKPSESVKRKDEAVLCSILCSVPLPTRYLEGELCTYFGDNGVYHIYDVGVTADTIIWKMIEDPTGIAYEAPSLVMYPNIIPHHITLSLMSQEPNVQHDQEQNDLSVHFSRDELQFWIKECPDEIYLHIPIFTHG